MNSNTTKTNKAATSAAPVAESRALETQSELVNEQTWTKGNETEPLYAYKSDEITKDLATSTCGFSVIEGIIISWGDKKDTALLNFLAELDEGMKKNILMIHSLGPQKVVIYPKSDDVLEYVCEEDYRFSFVFVRYPTGHHCLWMVTFAETADGSIDLI